MLPSYKTPFGARNRYSIFQSKTSRKTQKFSFAPSARRKMVDFLYGAPKTCRLFKVSVILPPSGKISAGAHAVSYLLVFTSSGAQEVVRINFAGVSKLTLWLIRCLLGSNFCKTIYIFLVCLSKVGLWFEVVHMYTVHNT